MRPSVRQPNAACDAQPARLSVRPQNKREVVVWLVVSDRRVCGVGRSPRPRNAASRDRATHHRKCDVNEHKDEIVQEDMGPEKTGVEPSDRQQEGSIPAGVFRAALVD
jgi:hypothetical protein